MALVNSAFTVNVTPGAMPPVVHVSEYDVGRTYTVTINGQNGSAFNIPSGTTATVEGTLNGVIGFTTGATISGSNVSFTLTESMTARSGKAWCKIKLTQNSQPIQTCAFVLAVDRAGVEAETVIGAPGFEEQIRDAAEDWLEEHGFQSPTVSITPITGGNRVTFTDAEHPQGQSFNVMNGSGLTDAIKTALLACFAKVAWIDQNGQTYFDALSDALYAEDEGGGDEGGGETSDYTDSAAWNYNKTIIFPYQGKGYLEAMSDLDARMVTKATKTLDSGSYYRISCASPYELYMIFCDGTDVCQAAVPTQGRTTNQVFIVSGYNKMGVVVATPSTATIADPSNAAVTLAKEKKQNGLRWSLNTSVYTQSIDQPFDEIKAPVDARMLLTSFIPLESGKTYQFRCNSPYTMPYILLLDENNMYRKLVSVSGEAGNLLTFTNSEGYAKASIVIKTPATATQADVSAIGIYVV